jgi:hypothetical protein
MLVEPSRSAACTLNVSAIFANIYGERFVKAVPVKLGGVMIAPFENDR